MNPGAESMAICLSRQDTSQPWGFRLQGGTDFTIPLSIQNVNPGSLADSHGLKAGDAILQINNRTSDELEHEEAKREILMSGLQVNLVVQRGAVKVWKPKVTPMSEIRSGAAAPGAPGMPDSGDQYVQRTSLAADKTDPCRIGSAHNRTARPFAFGGAAPAPQAPQQGYGGAPGGAAGQYGAPGYGGQSATGAYGDQTAAAYGGCGMTNPPDMSTLTLGPEGARPGNGLLERAPSPRGLSPARPLRSASPALLGVQQAAARKLAEQHQQQQKLQQQHLQLQQQQEHQQAEQQPTERHTLAPGAPSPALPEVNTCGTGPGLRVTEAGHEPDPDTASPALNQDQGQGQGHASRSRLKAPHLQVESDHVRSVSPTLQLIQAEESGVGIGGKAGSGARVAAMYKEMAPDQEYPKYQGYQNPSNQSRSFKLLQQELHTEGEAEGTEGAAPAPGAPGPVAGMRSVRAPSGPPANVQVQQAQHMVCKVCGSLCVGVFVKVKGEPMHPECYKCVQCAKSLKNQGFFTIEGQLYCDDCATNAAPPPGQGMTAQAVYR